MTKTVNGVVYGKTIELDEDPGVAEGQQVQITIKTVPAKTPWGEGLRRCAGALANEWTDEDDRISGRDSPGPKTGYPQGNP